MLKTSTPPSTPPASMGSSTPSWLLILRILIAAIGVQLAVWLLPLPRICSIIESRPRKTLSQEKIDSILTFIEKLSNVKLFVIRRNCLKKNLLCYYFLVTAHVTQLTLHIGIRHPQQRLDGHCWLTLNGKVFLDSEVNITRYTIMYSRGV